MTTSEHADLTPPLGAYVRESFAREKHPDEPHLIELRRRGFDLWLAEHDAEVVAIALASTPSPAQPTERGMGLQRSDGKWVVSGGTATDGFDTPVHRIAAGPWRPISEPLAPSPVQGADDRLAQAEAAIAQALEVDVQPNQLRRAIEQMIWPLRAYQQSPQAALNEVRAGALEEFADAKYGKRHSMKVMYDGEISLRERAAELRARSGAPA